MDEYHKIKTDQRINFCGGCNNQVELKRFIVIDENETIDEAWEKRKENQDDELFKRTRFMGFCRCGKIYILN